MTLYVGLSAVADDDIRCFMCSGCGGGVFPVLGAVPRSAADDVICPTSPMDS